MQLGDIFICGMACDKQVYQPLICDNRLSLSIDLWDMDDLSDKAQQIKSDIEQFMRTNKLDQVNIVGHSSGGYVLQVLLGLYQEAELGILNQVFIVASLPKTLFQARYRPETGTPREILYASSLIDQSCKFDSRELCNKANELRFSRAIRYNSGTSGYFALFSQPFIRRQHAKTPVQLQKLALYNAARDTQLNFGEDTIAALGERCHLVYAKDDPFISNAGSTDELFKYYPSSVTRTVVDTDMHMLIWQQEYIDYYVEQTRQSQKSKLPSRHNMR